MASQNAAQDDNQFTALIAHSGTVGTAETRKITSTGTPGALDVMIVGTSVAMGGGTVVEINKGTINLGSVVVTNSPTVNVNSGTINLGTVTLTNPTGTVVEVNKGTINVLAVGTITTGTVAVTIGTVVGPVASGGSETGAPVPIGGTDVGGTVRLPLIDSAGHFQVDVQTGTSLVNVNTGTITTGSLTNLAMIHAGTITALPAVNMASGTLNVGTATVSGNLGTLTTLTTVSNLTNGSVNVLTGTIQSSGTTTGVGVVSNLINGSINVLTGTITRISNVGTLELGTVSEKLATGFNGGTVSVGTAAVELTFTGTPRGILITADHNNGTMVYVGNSSVAQSGSAAIARLDPGESLSIEEFDDTSAALYAVAGTTAQKVYKVAFT